MKKNIMMFLLVLITIGLGTFTLLNSMSGDGGITLFKQDDFDIIKHAQQYDLLSSINLTNSLKPQCDFSNIEYKWDFPKETELVVYDASTSQIYLEDLSDDSVETVEDLQKAVENFYSKQPAVNGLSYDYIVTIFSETQSTYEKMPLFLNIDGLTVYTTNLGVWRDNEDKFIAGLYAVSNSFNTFHTDQENEYITFKAIDEEKTKKHIENVDMKFLNHEFLCEKPGITESSIESIEIVYTYIDKYLFPVYKIIGNYILDDKEIKWTALLNPIDFTALDYISYTKSKENHKFIPKPYIDDISSSDDKYIVQGYLSNNLKEGNDLFEAESVTLDFYAKEETGEYVYGDRKEELNQEINNSLEIESDGKFSFSFSQDNFWKVEELIYENSNEEPQHSQNIEIDRNIYDNWFQVIVCSQYSTVKLCSGKSKVYRLEREN